MNLGGLRTRSLRERVILLLLPVLAFRLLFPAGFMPRFGADLELSMQMCHGDAQSAAIIHALDDEPGGAGNSGEQHEAPCVFAMLGAFAAGELPPVAPAAVPRAEDLPRPAVLAPALRLPRRSQVPRAPPLPA